MTDRELLELAAKAAGIEIIGDVEKFIAQPNKEHIGGFIVRNNRGGDSCWNPLTDDGDALRLAVKLGLDIAIFDKKAVNSGMWSADHGKQWPSPINFGDDSYAATRRAIVRAAAEIGKAMQ